MAHFQPRALVMVFVVCTATFPVRASHVATPPAPVYQLRIYEIFEHNKRAFHERFRQHALPTMKRHGFTILSTWESKSDSRTEFVYLLQWSSEQTMKERWAAFLNDPEWVDIKARSLTAHGPVVGAIQDRVLRVTEYSPRFTDR